MNAVVRLSVSQKRALEKLTLFPTTAYGLHERESTLRSLQRLGLCSVVEAVFNPSSPFMPKDKFYKTNTKLTGGLPANED